MSATKKRIPRAEPVDVEELKSLLRRGRALFLSEDRLVAPPDMREAVQDEWIYAVDLVLGDRKKTKP